MIPIHRNRPRHSTVQQKTSYGQYKEELCSDFHKSCGYCACPDIIWGGKAGFQIDHFAPQNKFPELNNVYSNLIYSCPICNRGKSNKWPTNSADLSVKNNEGFIHPCSEEYHTHLSRSPLGEIICKTELGNYMSQTMKFSLTRHQIIWIRDELNTLIIEVRKHIDTSSELEQKYRNLVDAFFEYDELLKKIIDER